MTKTNEKDKNTDANIADERRRPTRFEWRVWFWIIPGKARLPPRRAAGSAQLWAKEQNWVKERHTCREKKRVIFYCRPCLTCLLLWTQLYITRMWTTSHNFYQHTRSLTFSAANLMFEGNNTAVWKAVTMRPEGPLTRTTPLAPSRA